MVGDQPIREFLVTSIPSSLASALNFALFPRPLPGGVLDLPHVASAWTASYSSVPSTLGTAPRSLPTHFRSAATISALIGPDTPPPVDTYAETLGKTSTSGFTGLTYDVGSRSGLAAQPRYYCQGPRSRSAEPKGSRRSSLLPARPTNGPCSTTHSLSDQTQSPATVRP